MRQKRARKWPKGTKVVGKIKLLLKQRGVI